MNKNSAKQLLVLSIFRSSIKYYSQALFCVLAIPKTELGSNIGKQPKALRPKTEHLRA